LRALASPNAHSSASNDPCEASTPTTSRPLSWGPSVTGSDSEFDCPVRVMCSVCALPAPLDTNNAQAQRCTSGPLSGRAVLTGSVGPLRQVRHEAAENIVADDTPCRVQRDQVVAVGRDPVRTERAVSAVVEEVICGGAGHVRKLWADCGDNHGRCGFLASRHAGARTAAGAY
jgi:hypothetical protein